MMGRGVMVGLPFLLRLSSTSWVKLPRWEEMLDMSFSLKSRMVRVLILNSFYRDNIPTEIQ